MNANDWGLPDWKDPTAYGETSSWNFMRWRWEFYRRRDDLRSLFDQNAEQTYLECVELYSSSEWQASSQEWEKAARILQPHEPGFTADCTTEDCRKFGYVGIPNPRISEQRAHVIFAACNYDGDVPFQLGEGDRFAEGKDWRVTQGEGEVLARFDLDKPLGPQIDAASNFLSKRQVQRHGRKLQHRRHPIKWLTYLRTLDAREVGASWSEISEILLQTAGTGQTARDTWEQAKALCFNF